MKISFWDSRPIKRSRASGSSVALRRIYAPEQCDLVIITNRYEDYFADLAREGVYFASTANSYPPTNSKLAKAAKHLILSAMRPAVRSKLFGKMAADIAATYPILLETWHHPQCSVRWIAYERFLTLNRGYGQVFLTDVRDVVFQAPLLTAKRVTAYTFLIKVKPMEMPIVIPLGIEMLGRRSMVKVIGKKALNNSTILGPGGDVVRE